MLRVCPPSIARISSAVIVALALALGAAPALAAHPDGRTARVIAIAKRYVGHARYVEGGSSPKRGFDCSGYTSYVFARAGLGTLPHNAEAQRRMKRMHRVAARSARPGDLVFYGKPAFHVAIYAGKHRQYSAATERDGIRYQPIWSRDVSYGRYAPGR